MNNDSTTQTARRPCAGSAPATPHPARAPNGPSASPPASSSRCPSNGSSKARPANPPDRPPNRRSVGVGDRAPTPAAAASPRPSGTPADPVWAGQVGPEPSPGLGPSPSLGPEPRPTAEGGLGIGIGDSPPMRALRVQVQRLARTPLSTVVFGETGTGKERVARALHAGSGRRGRWVVLCCATLPAALAESAILGHVKGAFTGASRDHAGVFEQADGGTLLLDEVGELPLALQPKLLRVLQEREVTPVGASRPRPVDVRVVAATHRDLAAWAALDAGPHQGPIQGPNPGHGQGRFRLDLYERLCQAALHLPPLRERPGDIAALAAHFVAEVAAARARPLRLTPQALAALQGARWPGNVRGLKNAVQRGAYLCAQPPDITVADLRLSPPQPNPTPNPTPKAGPEPEPGPVPAAWLLDPRWQALPLKEAAARNDAAFRRAFVVRCLDACGGNLTQAAARLGYSRKGLRGLLERLGLAPS